MQAPDHSLPDHSLSLTDPGTLRRARRWLLLGVVALGVAGIFAGLLANTKSDYFYTALVVHVDLSVLVWFLTMACMFFTLAGQGRGWSVAADAAFVSFALGALLIVLSGFTGGAAYMSNYIPVIHHPVFFLGLGLLFCGVLLAAVNLLAGGKAQISGLPYYGAVSAAWIMLIALACFCRSVLSMPASLQGQIYYEYAFWGGGHMLQFVHTQLMLVAWLWLAGAAGLKLRIGANGIVWLYLIGIVAGFAAPFIYLAHPPTSDEYRNAFTMLMKHANGLAPLVLGGIILYSIVVPAQAGTSSFYVLDKNTSEKDRGSGLRRDDDAGATMLPKICLLMSILLFAAGGGLGYLIAGSNVTVPAHYHGSIVGVTLAFMGVAYLLSPAFGFADVSRWRLAMAQPVIYGGGQLCWMAGMAMLGASGVPRKTPGSADTMGALASFLKHGGDGLALMGGLLFVFVVVKAVWEANKAKL